MSTANKTPTSPPHTKGDPVPVVTPEPDTAWRALLAELRRWRLALLYIAVVVTLAMLVELVELIVSTRFWWAFERVL